MRRFVLLTAVALAALAIAAATTKTTLAFTVGVLSSFPSPSIEAGHETCQKPLAVPPDGEFDRVDFEVGDYGRKHGPALDVFVRHLDGRRFPTRHGVLPAGYPDVAIQQRHVVRVGPVPAGAVVEVCVRNRGPHPVALFGNGDAAATASSGYIDGSPIAFDLDFVLRRPARSFATELPAILDRAALFRPPWVSPALYWVLLALLVTAVPLLLGRALQQLRQQASNSR